MGGSEIRKEAKEENIEKEMGRNGIKDGKGRRKGRSEGKEGKKGEMEVGMRIEGMNGTKGRKGGRNWMPVPAHGPSWYPGPSGTSGGPNPGAWTVWVSDQGTQSW